MAAKDWRGELLLAFGSGRAANQRSVARVRLAGGDTELSVFETRMLYEALGAEGGATGGAAPDVQGVALMARALEGRDAVRVFHHGSGSSSSERRVFDATVEFRLDSLLAYLDRCKRDPSAFLGFELKNPRQYDLDDYEGHPFHFTDAAPLPEQPGRVVFTALAQRPVTHVDGSPADDESHDAPVAAVAVGIIELDGSARYTIAVEKDGAVCERRVEGLALTGPRTGYLVVSASDEGPSVLATLDLSGL